jgi:hypothetical protein
MTICFIRRYRYADEIETVPRFFQSNDRRQLSQQEIQHFSIGVSLYTFE